MDDLDKLIMLATSALAKQAVIHDRMEKMFKQQDQMEERKRIKNLSLVLCVFCKKVKTERENPGHEWTYHVVTHAVSCPECYEKASLQASQMLGV